MPIVIVYLSQCRRKNYESLYCEFRHLFITSWWQLFSDISLHKDDHEHEDVLLIFSILLSLKQNIIFLIEKYNFHVKLIQENNK